MEPNSAAADYNRAINNTQATLAGSSASVDAYNPSNTQATLTPIAHNANNTQATLTQATLAESSRQTLSRTPTADSMRAAEKGHSAEKGQVGTKPPAAGAPAAGGGPPAPPGLKKYTHGFFDKEMKPFRNIVLKILGGTCVITIVVIWACATFYWGSLWKADKYIDRDGSSIGAEVSAALLNMTGKANPKYFRTSASEFPTMDAIYHDIVEEGAWASVVIMEGATQALQQARQSADASFDGRNLIQVVYAQARSETAIGSYLLPVLQKGIAQVTGRMSAESTAQFIASAQPAQIKALAAAPGTLVEPISYTLENIRPFNQPVATAITLVGLIYLLIFSFIITMTNNACREIIAPYMTTKHYILYRLTVPLILYGPLSFFFAMLNLPFKVHFGAHFTYAGGFFLWAFIVYLGMASVGFATEFMITILGPRFIAFFMIPLIIANVSVVNLPHELQPWIYRYGVAMPFFNASRAVRTIIFNTKNELGKNCGILLGWIGFSMITVTLATWLFRRNELNQHRKDSGEMEDDMTAPDGRSVDV